ncbi:TPA: hypothetical protein ACH3X1_003066 [Trebouxia sp. C0004]
MWIGCNMTTAQSNQFREKITAATQKVMWQKGFYPGDTEYDMIAMSVLSKPNWAAAKADYQLYVHLIKKAETAAKNYRTEVSKKISEMSVLPHKTFGEYKYTKYNVQE